MNTVIDNTNQPEPGIRTPPVELEHHLAGMRVLLLPPGNVRLNTKLETNILDINLGAGRHLLAVNSDRHSNCFVPADSLAFFPSGTTFKLQVDNPLPGYVLEVDDDLFEKWADMSDISDPVEQGPLTYRHDPVSAYIGRAGIHMLTGCDSVLPRPDRLTIEAMALSLACRAMARITSDDGDLDATIASWARRAHAKRITDAMDYVRSNVHDPDLSITVMADIANLSSSHFSSIFKSLTGESAYSFILRQRAQFAKDLILGTKYPLAEIAYASGFSSQSHMTVTLKKVFGATPGALRAG